MSIVFFRINERRSCNCTTMPTGENAGTKSLGVEMFDKQLNGWCFSATTYYIIADANDWHFG